MKWSPKIIRPWTQLLGFDPVNTNTFTYDPNTYATWFASSNVWPEATATPGVAQTFTVSTGTTGLTAVNFSVKAMSPTTGAGAATTPGPAATLGSVSGSGQSGTVGQPLSSPFVALVTDANGNPISGASVTFTVTAGGGTVNPASATSNSQGQASATLPGDPARARIQSRPPREVSPEVRLPLLLYREAGPGPAAGAAREAEVARPVL